MKTEKKTGADRTQLAVRDEWWTDERVQTFLDLETPEGEAPDYHVLLKAYRGMVPDAFSRLVQFFSDAGRNINEPGPDGLSLLHLIKQHRNSAEYAEILQDAGAK